jgi:hypothetical protein
MGEGVGSEFYSANYRLGDLVTKLLIWDMPGPRSAAAAATPHWKVKYLR